MAPSATCRGVRSMSAIGVYCPSQQAFIFCHVPSPRMASRPWLRRAITSVCWPASVFTIKAGNMSPPLFNVGDKHVHYEIMSPVLDVVILPG